MAKEDLSNKKLDAINLADTDLAEANLRKSSLRHAQLQRANLTRADLSESDLEAADLRAADLTGATLRGTNLTNADVRVSGIERADFVEEARLEGAKGVPDDVAKQQVQRKQLREDGRKKANPRSGHAGRTASEHAQEEQDRQLESGEESSS